MDFDDSFFPYFQPIISVASGRIVGYEVLARTRLPEESVVSAGDYFLRKDINESRLRDIDRHVRWQALKRYVELEEQCYFSLNISSAWIDSLSSMRDVPTLKMLEKLDIDRSRIIVEISEVEADLNRMKQVVQVYRRDGLRVAINNFGSGLFQLERVIAINPDILKINMRLFKRAVKGGISSDVVHLLTRFGKRLGSQVICEGVESEEEFLFGLNCGAQFFQGFLFAGASDNFLQPEQFVQHVAGLRKKFLSRKLAEEKAKAERYQAINDILYRLKEVLQNDFNINHLLDWQFEHYGILRFYLCNSSGDQVSPDFNFSQGKWFNDPRKIGFNWSWRPYFYQLQAQKNHQDGNLVVTSDQYKDFDTGQVCKTLTLQLDEERILMVDVTID